MTAFLLGGCFRPETVEECQRKPDERERRSCIEGNIYRDAGVGALGGAVVGAIIGAAAGSAGGSRGTLIGAMSGAAAGGLAGGAATYYIENQQASAMADIVASNYKFQALVQDYKLQDAQLKTGLAALETQQTTDRQTIESIQARAGAEVSDLRSLLRRQESEISDYRRAVITKYRLVPPDVQAELDRRNAQIASLSASLSAAEDTIIQMNQRGLTPRFGTDRRS